MFPLREFVLCEKEKAKAFSSRQPPSLEVLGNKASSVQIIHRKYRKIIALRLKKTPLNLL